MLVLRDPESHEIFVLADDHGLSEPMKKLPTGEWQIGLPPSFEEAVETYVDVEPSEAAILLLEAQKALKKLQ